MFAFVFCVQACLFWMLVIKVTKLQRAAELSCGCRIRGIVFPCFYESFQIKYRIELAVLWLCLQFSIWSDWWMMNVIQTRVVKLWEWMGCEGSRIQHTAQRMRDSSDYKRSKVPLYIVIPVGCSHLEKKNGENMKQSTVSRQSSLLLYFVVEIFHVRWGRVAECIIKSLK